MTTCNQINSELDAISGAANSISAKLDAILNQNNEILSKFNNIDSRLSAIEARLNGIDSKVDAINNLIDSLENIIVSSINRLSETLISLINGLFDLLTNIFGGNRNDRTDEILNAIENARNSLGNAIVDTSIVIGRGIENSRDDILGALSACCSEIIRLIRSQLSDDSISDILRRLDSLEGSIKESIGGSESRIIGEINQNENKLDVIIGKLDGNGVDWIQRILQAIDLIAQVLDLLRGKKDCDLTEVLTCCNELRRLILELGFDDTRILVAIDSSKQFIANKIDSTTNNILNVANNVYSNTNNILNAVNNVYGNTSNILNTVSNLTNNIQNVQNIVSNNNTNVDASNFTNINNSLSEIISRSLILQNTIQNIDCNGGSQQEVELVKITVPVFVRCTPETREPEFEETDIFVPKGLESSELLKFARIAEIEGKQCKNEAVALVPEWWQVRLEGGVPQFVLAFGEVDPNTGKCLHAKYAMTIPHFINIKPVPCPFPRYRKGNYELIAYFKDNSKLIINAFTEQECERVYNAILPWINQEYAATARYKIGKRVSYPFKEIWVCPKFGKYFSQGNRDTNPDWTVYYN